MCFPTGNGQYIHVCVCPLLPAPTPESQQRDLCKQSLLHPMNKMNSQSVEKRSVLTTIFLIKQKYTTSEFLSFTELRYAYNCLLTHRKTHFIQT